MKFLYSFPTLYYLHLIYTSFLVAFSPAAYISPTFLSSISHLSPTSSLLFASNTQLPTQYCLVVVHVCSLSGASSLSSGRAVQVAFMHTHTHTHTLRMRISAIAFPTAALTKSTGSHKQAHSHCCTIKQAFVSPALPLQSYTLTSSHA